MSSMNKSDTKTGVDRNLKALRDKATELRRRMSADKAAAIVSRLEDPSDSGDLSQQSHEEWLFLNRNNLEKSLLREVEEALLRVEEGTYGICPRREPDLKGRRTPRSARWARFWTGLVLLMLANSAYLVVVRRLPGPPRTS